MAAMPVDSSSEGAVVASAHHNETALCLSGGGYRAMVFHLGVLIRLNELGRLRTVARVSSVSGGSVTAGVLAMNWGRLAWDESTGRATNLDELLIAPVRGLAGTNIDITAGIAGLLMPFTSISDRVVKTLRRQLFGKTRLSDLQDEPRFVFNATSLQSAVLVRFSKPYIADYRVGMIDDPDLPLAVAVTASSAFPPFLSPCTVDLHDEEWTTVRGNDLTGPEYRGDMVLSDGGVYDNLGLQTVDDFGTVIVSDAGGQTGPDPDPKRNWGSQMLRVLHIMDNQVRALRKSHLVQEFKDQKRAGCYFGIRSDLADFPANAGIPAPVDATMRLASIATRLDAMSADTQERLVNWGYVVCDAAMRSHMGATDPATLPYPERPLG
jgi:NTE family protein